MRHRTSQLEKRTCAICTKPFETVHNDPGDTCSPECFEQQFAAQKAQMVAVAPVATSETQPARERIVADDVLQRIAASAKLHSSGDYYEVPPSKGGKPYKTTPWSCTCPDREHRGVICKHMSGVSLLCPPAEETVATAEDPFRGF